MTTKNNWRQSSISERLEQRVLLTTYAPNLLYTFAAPEDVSSIFANSDNSLTYVVGEGGGQIDRFIPGSAPTTLVNFGSGVNDPSEPSGEQFEDSNRDIFGATLLGGTGGSDGGTIFEWANGSPSITDLANFEAATTGPLPKADYMDASGNIYGTTDTGSTDGNGSIWEYHASTQLLTYVPVPSGMNRVEGSLIADSSGDIFGATAGDSTRSEFFEIAAATSTITSLATFSAAEPNSQGQLAIDSTGNMYGTASNGSASGGAFYEVPASNRSSIDYLASTSTTTDGAFRDASGDLFTYGLEIPAIAEEFFELPAGQHTAQQIASLDPTPLGDDTFVMTIASNGTIYGANQDGSTNGNGSLFSLTPGISPIETSSLSVIIERSTLPPTVLSTATIKGTVTIDVINSGTTIESSEITARIFALGGGPLVETADLLGSTVHAAKLKPGASTTIVVPIYSLPSLGTGTFTLSALVNDAAEISANSYFGPTLTAAAPFVAFSETVIHTTLPPLAVSGEKTMASVTLEISNAGNVTSTGDSTIALSASADLATGGTIFRTMSEPIIIKPGDSESLTLPLVSLPAVSNGSYYIVARVTDSKGGTSFTSSSATYELATPFISLAPLAADIVIGKAGTSTVGFTLVNQGNITATGSSTIGLYASPDGRVAWGTREFSETLSVPLAPGESKAIKLHLTAAQTQALQAAPSVVLQVADSVGGVRALPVVLG